MAACWPTVAQHTLTWQLWLLGRHGVTPGLGVFWQMVWICYSERQIIITSNLSTQTSQLCWKNTEVHFNRSTHDPQATRSYNSLYNTRISPAFIRIFLTAGRNSPCLQILSSFQLLFCCIIKTSSDLITITVKPQPTADSQNMICQP